LKVIKAIIINLKLPPCSRIDFASPENVPFGKMCPSGILAFLKALTSPKRLAEKEDMKSKMSQNT